MSKGHCPPNREESALKAASDRRGADKEVGTPAATSPRCVVASPLPPGVRQGREGTEKGGRLQELSRQNPDTWNNRDESRERWRCL